jgi:hypothetical protein
MSRAQSSRTSEQSRADAVQVSSASPFTEELVRREKTPFIMTSVGRRAKNTFGWEAGQTMYFSPDDPS